MRNRFLTVVSVILSVALPATLCAQTTVIDVVDNSQNNAKVLLTNSADKASLRLLLGKFTTLKTSFNQTITDLHGQELQSSTGELLLKKPQQLKWIVAEPEESLLVADGKTVYNVDPFVEQVTLLDQSSLTKSNPLMLLITDQESQWQQVTVVNNNNSFIITSLVPDSSITELTLNFGQNDKLMSIESTDRQQQKNRLLFSDMEYDSGVSNNDFSFTPEASWIVDDQREQEHLE